MRLDREFVVVCHGAAGDLPYRPEWDGTYLESYDPDAHDGMGAIVWTSDITKAMRFASFVAVMAAWQTTSTVNPVRDDGRPNRPLTAFNIEPRPVD